MTEICCKHVIRFWGFGSDKKEMRMHYLLRSSDYLMIFTCYYKTFEKENSQI